MRVIFHGQLRKLYGAEVYMASDTVADAIEGFSRQQSNWPRQMPISVVGRTEIEQLFEGADEIHVMPSLIGGGGKFGSIILGAAMVVAGVVLLGVPGGQAWGIPLIISGSLMVLQGVITLFMKSPKLSNSADPEASKYLPVNKNTVAQGTTITMAWGRIDLAGQWLSIQSDSSNLSFGVFPTNPT